MTIKRYFTVLLMFVLHFTTFSQAHAAGELSMNGWKIVSAVQNGSSTVFNMSKGVVVNGSNLVKTSAVAYTPTAAAIAKNIVKVGAVGAVASAIDLLLKGADYVMDPANNRVKYYIDDPNNAQYVYEASNHCTHKSQTFSNSSDANKYICQYSDCNKNPASFTDLGDGLIQCGGGYKMYSATRVINPSFDQTKRTEKYIPYTDVASQVLDDAQTGRNTQAPPYVGGVAQDVVNKGQGVGQSGTTVGGQTAETVAEAQKQLVDKAEANAKTETKEEAKGESKPKADGTGTDFALDFPVFCTWAPSVCEAAQVVISFPQLITDWYESSTKAISDAWKTVNDWVKDVKEFFKDEKVPETSPVDIEEKVPEVPDKQYFSWGAYCPFSPSSSSITLGGETSLIDYNLTSWCDFATQLRPFVIASGALIAFLIAAGLGIGRSET